MMTDMTYEENYVLLNDYKKKGLLSNLNFLEQTGEAGLQGYRGELVIIEGGVGDSKGHSKPPVEVIRSAVVLADDKLKLVIGAIERLESVNTFLEKYQADFGPDITLVFFVVNITQAMQVEIEGYHFILIPLVQGVPWNEIIDELSLEKSDFKGQSPAEKIVTVYRELKRYKPKSQMVSINDALQATSAIKREAWGAV